MRLRDFGLTSGTLPTGTQNALTDVSGVRVGHRTRYEGAAIRTGVTTILPHDANPYAEKVPAAVTTINGYGKAVGFEQVRELGCLETPIVLTNTLSVPTAANALLTYTLQRNPDALSVNPLVAECNDGYLNDIRGRHITEDDVLAAIDAADAQVVEGCVGAGTGTVCYGLKGGIGTASRLVGEYTLGALVQTNFGKLRNLRLLGMPLGAALADERDDDPDDNGSVIVVLATDAPLSARQLGRLCNRVAFGLGRTGTICSHGSGDFALAFSTGYRLAEHTQSRQHLPDAHLTGLFAAVVESVEEAITNALLTAETVTGRDGHTLQALPHDTVRHYIQQHRLR